MSQPTEGTHDDTPEAHMRWLQQRLEEAQDHKTDLRRLVEAIDRMTTELREERCNKDSLIEDLRNTLESMRDMHRAQLREQDKKVGNHFESLFDLLTGEEEYARKVLRREYLLEHLTFLYLDRKPNGLHNRTEEVGCGLYALWSDPATSVLADLLEGDAHQVLLQRQEQVDNLVFYVDVPKEFPYGVHHTVPSEEITAFSRDILCNLPKLQTLHLDGLPDFRTHVLPWLGRLPSSLEDLSVTNTPHTLMDIHEALSAAPHLEMLMVTATKCRDWMEAENLEELAEEEQERNGNRVRWI